MKSRILKGGIFIAALFFCSITKAQVKELACPAGQSAIQSMNTTDQANQQVRENFCFDGTGKIIAQGNTTLNPVLINQYTDNFNRTGTGLGANWTAYLNGVNSTLGPPGFAKGTLTVNFSVSGYTAVTSNITQRVRTGYLVMSGNAAGPVLNLSGTPGTSVSYYMCSLTTSGLAILRIVGAANGANGTVTTLVTTAVTGAAGDYVDFGRVGNDLSCMRNGSIANGFVQVDDTTPLTVAGVPGIHFTDTTAEIGYWTFFNSAMPASGTENIVFDGDSILAANGQGSPLTDPATSFLFAPNAMAYAVNLGVASKCLGVGCPATSGGGAVGVGTLQSMLTTGTNVIDPLFIPGVKNIVVLFTANNDVVVGGPRTPAQVITDMTTYVNARHAAGWKVIVCQSISRVSTSAPGTDQQESNLATLIAGNPFGADAIVTWPYTITATGASANTNLFNADQIHPTELTHVDIFAKFISATLSKF